ncbi:MAG: HD-GYP domain-containing protein [Candidatus Omnitrophota bacterium]
MKRLAIGITTLVWVFAMRVNYKRELEEAAKTMILVHKPHTLIKMILRMIVRKVNIDHAAILLFDKNKKSYIATVARGKTGLKIPAGLIRLDAQSPLIRYYAEKQYTVLGNGQALLLSKVNSVLQHHDFFVGKEDFEKLLLAVKSQLRNFETVVCVPCYHQSRLLGLLLLGDKVNNKPYKEEEIDFFMALAHDVAMALRNAFLFENLEQQIDRNKKLFFETTMALSQAIDAKDHYTQGHTMRVTNLSIAIGRKIWHERKEKPEEAFFENLHIASLLHDIGKIGVCETILNKKGGLTEEERKRINDHCAIGVMILEPIKDLKDVIAGVKYHHERYDGKGYPEGLKGDQTPLVAAIIAVADSYDAMTTDRPYRSALTKEQATAELERCSGSQFHPEIVKATVSLFEHGDFD